MEQNRSRLAWVGALVVIALLVAGLLWLAPGRREQRPGQALVAACVAGDVNGVRHALEGGADPNARDEGGLTPLMHAARGDHPHQADPAATDHPEVVRLLLEKGAQANAATDTGFVALFWAARYGHEKSVKTLLDHGADANARDKDGMTALKWAAANRTAAPAYDRVIALLKEAGAKD